jgi:hypothetical protein
MAWGAFPVLLDGFMFVPQEIISGGWPIGVGLIMLGLNAARYLGLKLLSVETDKGLAGEVGVP